jgi:predicted esterase
MQQRAAVRQRRRGGKKKIILISVAVFLALCIGASAIWLNIHYSAGEAAMQAMQGGDGVTVSETDGAFFFDGKGEDAALVFYPGGKVDSEAYAPLMKRLAAGGVDCFLLKLPFRLAVLDMNAANGIPEQYPQIKRWYIGGHSLGGSMAASHAAKNADRYEGLVLLASYSTADISASGLNVISLYGSEDGVLNIDKYAGYKANLPADFEEHVIDGGCHAGFGSYGAQEGDGTASISSEEQLQLTAQLLTDFFD